MRLEYGAIVRRVGSKWEERVKVKTRESFFYEFQMLSILQNGGKLRGGNGVELAEIVWRWVRVGR